MTELDVNIKTPIQKPFLKWIGGKGQILDKIISLIPKKMENYHELFLGGGSVLLSILSLQKCGKIEINKEIYAYDYNRHLIKLYNDIKNNKDEFFKYLSSYVSKYRNLNGTIINRNPQTEEESLTSKESYYYWLRKQYNEMNENSIEHSSLFLFLNKTCFRGMYRESSNGFNVPYGHYKTTPTFITREHLDEISDLIQNVHFIHSDFRDSIKKIKKGDFVYLDPPYVPENSISFVSYVADGFTAEMHEILFSEIKKMNGIKFMLSNSKVDIVLESFRDYKCEDIEARRKINPKNPAATTTEVIIYN